ncbi:hypothetical protein ACP4OV_011013 [Aristida adscensionis]
MASASAVGAAAAAAATADGVKYFGIERMADGRWSSFLQNNDGERYDVGEYGTAAMAALAQDRAVLAILGKDASGALLNFRAAFSDTELRLLRGRHSPARVAGVVAMVREGRLDAELARFAARAFDDYMDPELALDVAGFRLAHRGGGGELGRRMEAAAAAAGADPAARARAERDAEREAFVEAAKNKAMDEAWVESFHRRRRESGMTFEDENRWPPVVPVATVDVDWLPGEELLYLRNGSNYVDEMIIDRAVIKNTSTYLTHHV